MIVGHHYKMNALLGAIFRKRLNEADSGCKEFPSLKRTSLGLKINHNQVMYISPLLRGDPLQPVEAYGEVWAETLKTLECLLDHSDAKAI